MDYGCSLFNSSLLYMLKLFYSCIYKLSLYSMPAGRLLNKYYYINISGCKLK